MRITCDHCEKNYSVPSQLFIGEGRDMRCGECGSRWWQPGEGRSEITAQTQRRTLVVSGNGRYREEHHRFTSFFDGISSRFAGGPQDPVGLSSQRFERLKHSRGQRRYRETNAIVEAEFKEIRDFSHLRDWCRLWLPRIGVISLFMAAILIFILAS